MKNGNPQDKMNDKTVKDDMPQPAAGASQAALKSAADDILKAARAREKASSKAEQIDDAIANANDPEKGENKPASVNDEAGNNSADTEPVPTEPVPTEPVPTEPTPEETIHLLEAEKAGLHDQFLRALAELENVRKRAAREKADVRTYAIESFARDLLSVSDNMTRALQALGETERTQLSQAGANLLGGIEMTQKELHSVLVRHGISAIDAEPGAAFDPNLHQAVANIPSDHPAGTIANLFQGGWRIGERTLRAAMVAVSKGTIDGENAVGQDNEIASNDTLSGEEKTG